MRPHALVPSCTASTGASHQTCRCPDAPSHSGARAILWAITHHSTREDRDVGLKLCDISIEESGVFDPGNAGTWALRSSRRGRVLTLHALPAGGSYDLDLGQPYDRAVALELLRMASERPGVTLSRVTHVQGRKRTPITLERLSGPPQRPPSPRSHAPKLSRLRRDSGFGSMGDGAAVMDRRGSQSPADASYAGEAPQSPCVPALCTRVPRTHASPFRPCDAPTGRAEPRAALAPMRGRVGATSHGARPCPTARRQTTGQTRVRSRRPEKKRRPSAS